MTVLAKIHFLDNEICYDYEIDKKKITEHVNKYFSVILLVIFDFNYT